MSDTVSPSGLTAADVAARMASGDNNDAHEQTSRSVADILRANLFTRFNALIVVLTGIVFFVGSSIDAMFGIVVVINSAIGIFQEIRAKRVLDKLAILHAPVAHVVREGVTTQIPVTEVVLDDVLHVSIGDQIPVDGVVLNSEGLEIDESLLTGEADPIAKADKDALRSGSFVVAGKGYLQATAVGVNTYAHSITKQVKRFTVARSELVEGTNTILTWIGWIIVFAAPLIAWGQVVNSGNGWQEAILRSVAAIDGMIPQGLVLLTSLTFMLATLALVRRKVLVQQLPAVEGLARVNIICLDKTGTLTEGKIAFSELIVNDHQRPAAEQMLAAFSAEPTSPTLQALQAAFRQTTPTKANLTVPFSSARKWSAMTGGNVTWILGAPEMILTEKHHELRVQANQLADAGKRVLGLLTTSETIKDRSLPAATTAIGLVVLAEKARDDARETLAFFQEQGVRVAVISGDSPRTVGAIAREVGIDCTTAFDARQLPTDPHELADLLETENVFGRVTPDQKRAMVKALQAHGHTVAMTGDGVNDALALKDADIGIAMGSGAAVTKAVAELVLLDNKFAHMPKVLAEGRRVIANIERVASLFIIKNVYSLCLALAVTVAASPYPFLPRHLTILSVLTIGIPAFVLSLAPNNRRYVPGFLRRILQFSVPSGIVIAALIFVSFLLVSGSRPPAIVSTVGTSIVFIVAIWIILRLSRPLRPWKLALVLCLTAAYSLLIFVPRLREAMGLAWGLPELLIAAGLGLFGGIAIEVIWRLNQQNAPQQASTATRE